MAAGSGPRRTRMRAPRSTSRFRRAQPSNQPKREMKNGVSTPEIPMPASLTIREPDRKTPASLVRSLPRPMSETAHVLVVDDDEQHREMIASMVSAKGYTPEIARDGEEA